MHGPPDALLVIGQQVGLVAIVVLLVAAFRRVDVAPLRSHQQVLTGLVFGLGAILAMQTREKFIPSLVFDTPSVLLAMSGLVCGPWSVIVTAALTASYRWWAGGGGLLASLYSIALVSLAGAGLFVHLRRRNRQFDYVHLPVLAAVTTAITLSSLAFLPSGSRAAALQDLWLQLAARNFIGIGLLGALLIEERRRRELAAALAAAAEHARRQAERIRTTEEQLRQVQKMQTLGQLTGGIAHDFNNLVLVVLGNAETLVEELEHPRHRDLAEQILQASERAADLTQKLLTFGRPCRDSRECESPLACLQDSRRIVEPRCVASECVTDLQCEEGFVCQLMASLGQGRGVRVCVVAAGLRKEGQVCSPLPRTREVASHREGSRPRNVGAIRAPARRPLHDRI